MSAAAKRQFSFADWEMFHQNVKLDPILQTISDLLDDNAAIIDAIRRDLDQGLKNPDAGRDGLTPQQVLRSLVLRRVKNWDYRELRERIADGFISGFTRSNATSNAFAADAPHSGVSGRPCRWRRSRWSVTRTPENRRSLTG